MRNSGAIQGVLNLTTARSDDARTNRLLQDIVTRAARRVESRYFSHMHRHSILMHLSRGAASGDPAEEGASPSTLPDESLRSARTSLHLLVSRLTTLSVGQSTKLSTWMRRFVISVRKSQLV